MLSAVAVAALDAGAAWFEDFGAGGRGPGTVCGVFRHACYVRFPDRLAALCDAGVASGPLHLRLSSMPALERGDRIEVHDGWLETRVEAIVVPPERRWAPPPVDPGALEEAARRRSGEPAGGFGGAGDLEAAWDPEAAWKPDGRRWERLAELVAAGDLVALARTVGGRGPGLTPAGDDFLAGVLVVDALRHPTRLAERRTAAGASVTTDVAAAFLRWAVLGQCIQPVHDVVAAVVSDDSAREAQARSRLRGTGASSGAALLLGLDQALSVV
ncbi:MAG TPA: DUF2877 domain-containing protein [Acidimicrobiales bacterium]|nr:DUF2877 domain-containing protein [Acidimicrobiales bacterium]